MTNGDMAPGARWYAQPAGNSQLAPGVRWSDILAEIERDNERVAEPPDEPLDEAA